MVKNSNGEGTKFKLKNGKWRAAIVISLPDGTKKRIYRQFRTRREADEWLTKMKADIQAGRPVLCSDQTFGEYMEKWYKKYGSVAIRDSTKTNYLGYLRHIQRHKVKDIKLMHLTTDDLQEFVVFLQYNGQLDTGQPLSAKTLHNIFNMIHPLSCRKRVRALSRSRNSTKKAEICC